MRQQIRDCEGHMDEGLTAGGVADRFDELVGVSGRFERELRSLSTSSAPCSQATVDQLARLLVSMRPAASARAQLAGIDPDLLLAGVALWIGRQDDPAAGGTVSVLRVVTPL